MLRFKVGLLICGLFSSVANAALHHRGEGMVYDDVLDITWLQDANQAASSGYHSDGLMGFEDARIWADQLIHAGLDDWRLPKLRLRDGAACTDRYDGTSDCGYNVSQSEIGHMFYNNLGNDGDYSPSGIPHPYPSWTHLSAEADGIHFSNFLGPIFPQSFWLSAADGGHWAFDVSSGYQGQFSTIQVEAQLAWAVRDGDVVTGGAPVPLPGAAWMFLTGLGILLSRMRRRIPSAEH